MGHGLPRMDSLFVCIIYTLHKNVMPQHLFLQTVPTGNGKTPILAKSVFAFATGAILFYDVNR